MVKKVVFSAKMEHDIIKTVIPILNNKIKDTNLIFHDPTKDFFDLADMRNSFSDVDLMIVKVGSECSLDLLHFAKLYNIPTLHDIDTIILIRNKVALDHALRKVLHDNSHDLEKFSLPKSWTQNLLNVDRFKKWAVNKLPLVLKSHFQHDKYMRFNFLVREIKEVDQFCKKYSNFLYYDVYIQKFIECDGIDRKIYVIGDKIFGLKRENPIYIYMRDKPDSIDVDVIEREKFNISKNIKTLASILSRELHLKIFGFDLIKPINQDKYYLIDLNDFPGLRGIENIEHILADFIKSLI
ncbi:MAG: hypothetical protein EU532_06985 [Promethearchaeota archaeon]|nr:MAG: hypothetical protein EU532_06985 [Candidatus Lokiarchaeota archaeon]